MEPEEIDYGRTSIARHGAHSINVLQYSLTRNDFTNYLQELVDSYYLLLWYFGDMIEWNSSSEHPKVIQTHIDGVTTRYEVIPKPTTNIGDANLYSKRLRGGLLKVLWRLLVAVRKLKAHRLPPDLGPIQQFGLKYERIGAALIEALGDSVEAVRWQDLEKGAQRIVVFLLERGEKASRFEALRFLGVVAPEPVPAAP
ncbi:hypothetical protein NA57DRAFT_77583 [Rhizodiscina lignyota]|uniref:Uncharacterized protein n=1 Tax=Rhizodiscina lignyota TaxID=1504668 RepID=A0A9P4M4Z9_9PEZI|nr:hypothetical protein NA57DRAFT_77583 [Rhizodiscina lignyota]